MFYNLKRPMKKRDFEKKSDDIIIKELIIIRGKCEHILGENDFIVLWYLFQFIEKVKRNHSNHKRL